MTTYSNNQVDNRLVQTDLRRLINQIWKLLPMRENGEEWQKQLGIVLNELHGLHKLFGDQLDFLVLLSKLEGLYQTPDFMPYRLAVFSSISLLTELANRL